MTKTSMRFRGIGLSALAVMSACGTGGGSAGGGGGAIDAGPGGGAGGEVVGGTGGTGGVVVGGSGGSGGEVVGGSGGAGGEVVGGAGGEVVGGAGGTGGSGGAGGAVVGGSGGAGGEIVGGSGGAGGEVVGGSGGAGGEIVGGSGGAGGAGGAGGEGPAEPVGVCEGNGLPIYDAALAPSEAEPDFWTASGTLISEATDAGTCGGLGAETLLQFTAPLAGYWFFTTGQSAFDSVLYLRSACDDTESELACHDDVTPFVYQSGVAAELAEGQTIYLYVDAYSALVGTPWDLRVFRYDLSLSPEVGGEAYILPEGGLGLSVATNDVNGDAVETLVTFLDAAGEPMDVLGSGATEFAVSPQQTLMGLRTDVTRVRLLSADFGFDFGTVAAVTVRTYDLAGNEVGPFPIPLMPQPVVDDGAACDPAEVASRCADGLTCAADPGAVEGVCEVAVAPTLTALDAWYSPDRNLVLVGLEGEDRNADVVAARVELLAEGTGEAVDLTGFGEYLGGLAVLGGELAGVEAIDVQGAVTGGFGVVYLPNIGVPVDRVRVRLVDGSGLESAPLEANIGDPIVRIVGEACDPNGYLDGCIEGAVCRDAVCVQGTAPVITSAAAFRNPDNALAVTVGFVDEILDVNEVRVSLLTADSDLPIVLDADGNTAWTGPGQYTVGPDGSVTLVEFVGPDGVNFGPPGDLSAYPDAVRASITLYDASGLNSDTITVQIQNMIVVGENGYCDHARTTGCADGLVCVDLPDFSGATCVTRMAPVLNTLRVVDNRVNGRFGIDVQGVDPDDDIQYVQINLFDGDPDAGGVPVSIPAWGGETATVFFDITESDGENFHGQLFLESNDPASPLYVPPFTHARVALVDAQDLRSDPLTVVVETALPVAAGEPCDVLLAFDYCADGLSCDFDARVCVP